MRHSAGAGGTLGPFLDAATVRARLGTGDGPLSVAALSDMCAGHRILACIGPGRVQLFPAWQFAADGLPLPGLAAVLALLGQARTDGWDAARWLRTPLDEIGSDPVGWLRRSLDPAPVLAAARAVAARRRRITTVM